jgi:hypothetical protein
MSVITSDIQTSVLAFMQFVEELISRNVSFRLQSVMASHEFHKRLEISLSLDLIGDDTSPIGRLDAL